MKSKKLDSRGIEPRTTPMLRGYYTTKPQARLVDIHCTYLKIQGNQYSGHHITGFTRCSYKKERDEA
jgi:hypothetical protein